MGGIPHHRQARILDAVLQHGTMSIEQLMSLTGVSHMTVHRDLHTLAARGLLLKTHGGAARIPQDTPQADGQSCALCSGEISPRVSVTIRLKSGQAVTSCCPHCGISALGEMHADGIQSILTRDFLYQQTVDARAAWFVVDSQVTLCCRPGVLCFVTREDAARFQAGFGGHIYTLSQASHYLAHLHGDSHAHSA
jgi:DeoR family transcriptional regulator, copper-sensing transcriptional repressor